MNDHQIVRLLSGAQYGRHHSASLILGTYVPFEVGTPTPLVRSCVPNYHFGYGGEIIFCSKS